MKQYPFQDLGIDNIEVEDLETLLLPNGELFEVTGKTHDQGGEPAFAPDGTRIYSEKLKANPELSKEITGKNYKNDKSFAELTKLYDTGKYKDIMNNSKDDLTTRTAELMFNKLNGQLDNIFYAQEAYKAKKGLPNEANNLAKEMGGELPKYQTAGSVHTYPVPEYAQNIFKGFEYSFDQGALDPINIPRVQHANKQGTYGRARDVDEFIKYNNWYFKDRPHFDVTNSDSVRRYQETYNRELQARYSDRPELIESMKLVEDGKFGEATSRTTLPNRNTDIPNKLAAGKVNPFTINSKFEHEMDLGTKPEVTEEVQKQKVGIDPMALSDAMKTGMSLSELLSLRKDNPYYTGTTVKPALQRFNPVNTLANERAYNMQKDNLRQSGIPEAAQQAILSQGQARFQEGVNQVSLSNYQGDNQVDNANTSAIINAYNQNNNIKNQANYQYAQESTIMNENYDLTRANLTEKLFDLYDDRNYRAYSRDLMSQLSNNYMIDKSGKVKYVEGSKADPTAVNPLQNYQRISPDEIESMSKEQLAKLIKNMLSK